jgi:uncharacterized protein involved in exopolysaccharide biosynthesis
MIHTEIQSEPIVTERNETIPDPFRPETELSLLDVLAVVVQKKRFIGLFVLGATALAIAVAFLLPVRYEAKVLLLPPTQDSSSIGSALLGQLGGSSGMGGAMSSLFALAGGGILKNPADMYVSLLTSRSVEDAMIQRFDLRAEYHKKRMIDARKKLESRTTAASGSKDGLIRLTIEDGNPKRAAELANGYVEEFRKLFASLAITEASRRRLFFEEQLQQVKTNLSAAEEAMKKTQQSTGVLQIDSQARALIESAAILRAQVVAKQVQIEAMRSFASEGNPNLILAKQELSALESQLARLSGAQPDSGSDINLSKGAVTEAGLEYLRRYRDLRYQETVYELLAKEFEVAKLDEAREGSIIQVVDPAVVPDKRSFPPRVWIVIGATVLSFFIAAFWVMLREKLDRAFESPENQQRLEAIREGWKA